jgi:hypothetical protein
VVRVVGLVLVVAAVHDGLDTHGNGHLSESNMFGVIIKQDQGENAIG